jgi:hypothetical protein
MAYDGMIKRTMEQIDSTGIPAHTTLALKNRVAKWREHIRVEAIRARGYEADEIMIRGEERQ